MVHGSFYNFFPFFSVSERLFWSIAFFSPMNLVWVKWISLSPVSVLRVVVRSFLSRKKTSSTIIWYSSKIEQSKIDWCAGFAMMINSIYWKYAITGKFIFFTSFSSECQNWFERILWPLIVSRIFLPPKVLILFLLFWKTGNGSHVSWCFHRRFNKQYCAYFLCCHDLVRIKAYEIQMWSMVPNYLRN